MELKNEFRVPVPVDEAWRVLTDIERIAPCMPGAQLDDVTGEDYHGVVKVKVGPMTANYKGAVRFVERDDTVHQAVLQADGRETRGQGNANARITAHLTPSPDDAGSTIVSVTTDLTVSGRVAQFGRGVLADVSSKLMSQFATCLEGKLQDGASDQTGSADDGQRSPEAEPVDLLGTAGAPVAKRLVPVLVIAAAVALILMLLRRRRCD